MSFIYTPSTPLGVRTFDPAVMRQTANYEQTLCGTAVFPQSTVTINTLYVWLFALNATHPTIELGIYSAAGAKLGSNTAVPTAVGILSVALTSPITLNANTLYYLAYLNRTNELITTVGTGYGFATDTTLSFTQASLATMPANWGTLVNSSNNNWWIAGSN